MSWNSSSNGTAGEELPNSVLQIMYLAFEDKCRPSMLACTSSENVTIVSFVFCILVTIRLCKNPQGSSWESNLGPSDY